METALGGQRSAEEATQRNNSVFRQQLSLFLLHACLRMWFYYVAFIQGNAHAAALILRKDKMSTSLSSRRSQAAGTKPARARGTYTA